MVLEVVRLQVKVQEAVPVTLKTYLNSTWLLLLGLLLLLLGLCRRKPMIYTPYVDRACEMITRMADKPIELQVLPLRCDERDRHHITCQRLLAPCHARRVKRFVAVRVFIKVEVPLF